MQERRHATVLFADVSGWTSLVEELDPEDVQAMAHEVTGLMGAEVHRFGGTVISVMGDAVMAVFGAPIAHEDDAERAVRAAVAMREVVAASGGRLADVHLHVGINTGEGMAGQVGPEGRRDYTVVGDVTNTAARLQSHAGVGEILVGAETRTETANIVDYEDRSPIAVKGKRDPVAVWSVVGVRTASPERIGAAPMVGREAELELISSLWARTVSAREPRLVTVSGMPGIGKSRLIREVARSIEPGGRHLKGRCFPFGETTGYGAFGQQVKQSAGILDSDPESVARVTLADHVRSLVPSEDAAELAAHLSIVLGLEGRSALDRQALFSSLRRYVEALARDRPTALIFEDLHWAEPTLLDLIASLSAWIREGPLLLLTSARPGFFDTTPSWGNGLPYVSIPLGPLPDEEAARLAADLLERGSHDADAILDLVTTSGGNPLFLEELASSLDEPTTRSADRLPTTIQGIIAARLDALPRRERRVVQSASAVGRLFWRGSLIAMGADPAELDDDLRSLESRELIIRQPTSRLADDPEYQFKHVLSMEVAYATLPRGARRELHGVVARFLEDALGDRVRASASLLAHHWMEADEPARALGYLVTAADVAAGAAAKSEAIALFTKAVDLAREIGDDEQLERASFGRIWARIDIADYAAALEDVEAWLDHPDPVVRGRAAHARSRLAFMLADAPGLKEFAERTKEIALAIGDGGLKRRADALVGVAAFLAGDRETFLEAADVATATWPAAKRDVELGFTMSLVPLARYWDGRYDEGIELARAGYEFGAELSSVSLMLFNIGGLALNLTGRSRYEEALEWLERGATMGREWETKPQWTGRTLNMHAGALREIWDLAGARRLSEEGLEAGLEAGFIAASVSARIDLAMTDLMEGEVGRTAAQLPELAEAVQEFHGWHQWLWTERLADMRAAIAVASGRHDDAATEADNALRYLARYPRPKYEARVYTTRGEAMLGLGRAEDAVASFRLALDRADAIGQATLRWPALDGLARALDRTGGVGADVARRSAGALIEEVAAGLAEERRSSFLQAPSVSEVLERAR